MNKHARLIVLFVLLVAVLLLMFFCGGRPGGDEPPISLQDPTGRETSEFQLHDSVVFTARDLEPRTGYRIEVADEDGNVVLVNELSTDQHGMIPSTILWYAIGSRPCWQREANAPLTDRLAYSQVTDVSFSGRAYSLRLSRGAELVYTASFSVAEALLRPTIYTADSRGCPQTGFLIGEQDVWVVGRNLPKGGLVRLWAVPADSDWRDGDELSDQTKLHGYQLTPLIELAEDESSLFKMLWPRGLTSVGSYDVVAEVVSYPFGSYRDAPVATAINVISSRFHSGFVIQRRPGTAEPLEVDIAGWVGSPFTFRSTFLTTENVYVGVDPVLQPTYVGQTAKVYIVQDKTDAQWTLDKSLADVTGFVETITVNGICGNCWKTLAWTAPLTPGEYDVVLDFDQDGLYTPGTDLIDSLDPVGFTVSEVRVDAITFNYAGSGAVTMYDHLAAGNVPAPEYLSAGHVVKPAAWVKGGNHKVRVSFVAVPSVTQADIWAEGGIGGLQSAGSPVMVSFSGGVGQADFDVNNPPGVVAKSEFSWVWKYTKGGPTIEMGQTGQHVLYSVIGTPNAPQAVPWVGALDVACQVASGTTTAAAAARAIWSDFYSNAGGYYDTVSGAPSYGAFNLTKWLTNYGAGNIGKVNCYDMGRSVQVFANALGCSADYTYTSPFGYLNLVKPIGKGWANNPFYDNSSYSASPVVPGDSSSSQGRSSFANHAFTTLSGQIFDGSGGQVDIDGNPDDLPAGQPHELDGDDSWLNLYRDRVIDDVPASSPGTPTIQTFTVY